MNYFSDRIVSFFASQGVEYVAFNPGASFRGVHDSLVALRDQPDIPKMVIACHEEIAVAIAHGYYKACGKHMAVLLHANVGVLHASMAIFNAWCDRVPLLLLGGNGPLDASQRRPWIDWIHTSQPLDSVLQGYVKWSDMPVSQKATLESLYRGMRLMCSGAPAPVFIGIDAEVQEQPLAADLPDYPACTAMPAQLPGLDSAALTLLGDRLAQAKQPLIVADLSGQQPESVPLLVELAELLGCAVLDKAGRYNFPNNHPLAFSEPQADLLAGCDLLLALEVADLAGVLASLPADRWPPLVTLSCNDLATSSWVADYQQLVPTTLAYHVDVARSLGYLLTTLRQHPALADNAEREQRRRQLSDRHHSARDGWQQVALAHQGDNVMHVTSALQAIHDELRQEEWVVANTGSVTIDMWVKRLWDLERPGCYLGLSGGAGLGYGLGASIGAALAHQRSGRLCIDLQADGDFLYTPSALWTLSQYQIPLLIIVMNNNLYLNAKQHAERIATLRQRNVADADIGTSFEQNPVDFPALAQAFNIHCAGRTTSLDELRNTLREAIDWIRQHGKPALLEVVMQ